MKSQRNVRLVLECIVSVMILLAPLSGYATNQAIVLSGDYYHDEDYQRSYWNSVYCVYNILLQNGFTHDTIHLFYHNGSDCTGNGYYEFPQEWGTVTDYATSLNNLGAVCSTLHSSMNDDDLLFVFIISHGDYTEGGDQETEVDIIFPEGNIHYYQLAQCIDNITINDYDKRIVCINSCRSSGFLDNFENNKSYVMSSTRHDLFSGYDKDENNYDVTKFVILFYQATRRVIEDYSLCADDDDNGIV